MARSSVKDQKQYEALRRHGASKEKAARIANASATILPVVHRPQGRKSQKYEEWIKQDLYDKAKQVGIEGRSSMSKSELVDALSATEAPGRALLSRPYR